MRYEPNYIIYKQATRYLNKKEKTELIKKVSHLNIKHKTFLKKLTKWFDIEVFKTAPLIWQDIWLYNYIMYETNKEIKKNGLIAFYEKHAFIDNDIEFFRKKAEINNQNFNP